MVSPAKMLIKAIYIDLPAWLKLQFQYVSYTFVTTSKIHSGPLSMRNIDG